MIHADLIAAGLVLWAGTAWADPARNCRTVSYEMRLVHGNVADVVAKELHGDEAVSFFKHVNDWPPKGDILVDEVVLFSAPSLQPLDFVAGFLKGCRVFGGEASHKLVLKWLAEEGTEL